MATITNMNDSLLVIEDTVIANATNDKMNSLFIWSNPGNRSRNWIVLSNITSFICLLASLLDIVTIYVLKFDHVTCDQRAVNDEQLNDFLTLNCGQQ